MGGSSSTRRITVVNDTSTGVIRISESVARKLKGEDDLSNQNLISSTQQKLPSPQPTSLTQQLDPLQNYYIGACDTVALRQNHDAEIKRLEQTWKTHINKLEEQNEELFKRANEKFSSDLSELEQKYLKKRYEPVCQEAEQKVLNCYIINKSQPLKCSNEVKEYSQCVKKIRKDYFNRNV